MAAVTQSHGFIVACQIVQPAGIAKPVGHHCVCCPFFSTKPLPWPNVICGSTRTAAGAVNGRGSWKSLGSIHTCTNQSLPDGFTSLWTSSVET